jgi:hypothetical protein
MRQAAWRSQGVAVLRPEDIRDDWTRQALINEVNRLYGCRPGVPDEQTGQAAPSARPRARGDPREGPGRPDRVSPSDRHMLGKMLRAGTIDQGMYDAAKDFQAAFIVATLDPFRALPILRVPGTDRAPVLNDRQLHARHRVHEAFETSVTCMDRLLFASENGAGVRKSLICIRPVGSARGPWP